MLVSRCLPTISTTIFTIPKPNRALLLPLKVIVTSVEGPYAKAIGL